MIWNNLLRLSVFLFSALNLIHYFFPSQLLFYVSMVFLVYILVASMINLPAASRNVVIGLFLCATVLMLYTGANLNDWLTGLGKNGLLVAFFTFAALLHLPFGYDDYQTELKHVAQLYMHTMLPFNLLISIPTHMFGALTGFAAFAIMYNLFLETSKLYNAEDIFIATLGRSYSTSGFWGTSWVSVVLVVSQLHIPWYRLILVGILYTAVSFGINLASIKLKMVQSPGRYPTLTPNKDTAVKWARIWIMTALALSIVLITLVANQITGWSLLAIVPLVSILFPIITALPQGKTDALKQGVKNYAQNSLFKGRMNACIFTAAGLLAHALDISGVGAAIPRLIPAVFTGYPYLLVLTIMLLIILPGQLGIHPVATGTTLVATIVPSALGLSVPVFAMTIICGWLLSNMLSPFSALNLTLSGLSGKSTWYTGLKLSWRYGLVCLLVYGVMVFATAPLLGNPV